MKSKISPYFWLKLMLILGLGILASCQAVTPVPLQTQTSTPPPTLTAIPPTPTQIPPTVTPDIFASPDLSKVMISLSRDVCFGTCPAYSLRITGDGKVIYNGDKFVKVKGRRIGSISLDQLKELIAEFERVNFFSLHDFTDYDITDGPTYVVSISINGYTKTVQHYTGDTEAPKDLSWLENKIDEITTSCQWVGPNSIDPCQCAEMVASLANQTTSITTNESVQWGEQTYVRWYIGLGQGTSEEQIDAEEKVTNEFNKAHPNIFLQTELIPHAQASEYLSQQIALCRVPDIVGLVTLAGANNFHGQWLDLAPLIEQSGFDTSIFTPAMVDAYKTDEGQVGLPFAAFPGAMYYLPAMFDQAGLNYPPQTYGEKYILDGRKVDWNWDTVTEVAKRLTLDASGKNALEDDFNRSKIVRVGLSLPWQTIQSIGTYYAGAAKLYSGDMPGNYVSTIPDSWKEAFRWYYEGMWGKQPFIARGPLASTIKFGKGNVFAAGKAAMALSQSWYTCCITNLRDSNSYYHFQIGIIPMGADGKVHGRVDADTFRISKSTWHPQEALAVYSYLITTGADKLLPVYGAMSAIPDKNDAYFEQKSQEYPFVTQESWDVFTQGLAYPDNPSADQYLPNQQKANARWQAFMDTLNNTPDLDFEAEFQKLVNDLNAIYNEK